MKTCCCNSKNYQVVENQVICNNENCDNFLKTTKFVKSSTIRYMVAISCFSLLIFWSYQDYCFSEKAYGTVNYASIKANETPLTSENLKLEINRQDIFCPNEVYAQMQLESGRLGSYLSKKANNLLGMRFPFKRATSAIGLFLPAKNQIVYGTQDELLKYRSENNYAVYANWQDCVKDYKLWQKECFKLKDKYLAFLGTYYAEDSNYISKIKSFKD
jgi:hypothetical protein